MHAENSATMSASLHDGEGSEKLDDVMSSQDGPGNATVLHAEPELSLVERGDGLPEHHTAEKGRVETFLARCGPLGVWMWTWGAWAWMGCMRQCPRVPWLMSQIHKKGRAWIGKCHVCANRWSKTFVDSSVDTIQGRLPKSPHSRSTALFLFRAMAVLVASLFLALLLWFIHAHRGRILVGVGIEMSADEALELNIPLHHVVDLPDTVKDHHTEEEALQLYKHHHMAPMIDVAHLDWGCGAVLDDAKLLRIGIGSTHPDMDWFPAPRVTLSQHGYPRFLGVQPMGCPPPQDGSSQDVDVHSFGEKALQLLNSIHEPCFTGYQIGWNASLVVAHIKSEDAFGISSDMFLVAGNPVLEDDSLVRQDYMETDVTCIATQGHPVRPRSKKIVFSFLDVLRQKMRTLRISGDSAIALQRCTHGLQRNPCM